MTAALRAGTDPERADSEGTAPLCAASVNGRASIAGLLLSAGASPGTVRELLVHGADPDVREDHGTGWSPLERARHGSRPATVALLTAAGASGSR
ncbi:hypothetical protein [Streptomyces sp. NPDC051554]|uniref:hypothetical protein n=1 Tax=Streptomyces sp. NPDC051554 TaxID=3365656 RepID=UPI0037A7616A